MVSTVSSTPFLMSSKWFGSTETVGVSTKRCSSFSNSSRCELAKDKRLSRFNVVGIQDPPSNCRCESPAIIKQIGPISPIGPYSHRRPFLQSRHLHAYGHSKGSLLRVILASRVSDRNPALTVRTQLDTVFRRVA